MAHHWMHISRDIAHNECRPGAIGDGAASAVALEIDARLQGALDFAQPACELILKHFSAAGTRFDIKDDGTPVTIADKGAEEILRREIERAFGDDGIVGEEFGTLAAKVGPGQSGYRWVLDPIDGTKPFTHGVPLFGLLIGIEHGSDELGWTCDAGLCVLPALGEAVFAQRGCGAWHVGQLNRDYGPLASRARVSAHTDLGAATCCYTSMNGFERKGRGEVPRRIGQRFGEVRGWSDCYGYVLVATGRVEAMIDPAMKPWDVSALVPIITEAGGVMTGWKGETGSSMPDCIAGNVAGHAALVGITAGEGGAVAER